MMIPVAGYVVMSEPTPVLCPECWSHMHWAPLPQLLVCVWHGPQLTGEQLHQLLHERVPA